MLVLGTAFIGQLQAQTFYEDFQGGAIPATWTVVNNDSLVPKTDAWVINDDGDGNFFATSTSWYTPAGTSDDWLISPPITLGENETLSWKARAQDVDYPDGYEVRISTTDTALASFLANPALFSVANENATFTNRFVNLDTAGYRNQTVYIAYRNNSSDQFLLHVDEIKVDTAQIADAALSALAVEYTLVPLKQVQTLNFTANISNIAPSPIANAYAGLSILNLSNSTVPYSEFSDTIVLLPAGQNQNVNFTNTFTPTDTGQYAFVYILYSDAFDVNSANDTIIELLYVSDTVYARDNGQGQGLLGIGAGSSSGNYLGQSYEIVEPTAITSVTAVLGNPTIGDTASIAVFSIDNGVPGALVAESELFFIVDSGFQVVDFVFPGIVVLTPDTYAVVIREYSENITIATTEEKFTNGTTWINWPGSPAGGWANTELFGANFARSFLIRPNFGDCAVTIDTAFVQQPSCPDALDGLIIVDATANFGSLTFDWAHGDQDSIAEFLRGDVYTVTIEDGIGCKTVESYNLDLVAPIQPTITVVDASTATATDGSASVAVTGGTPPYFYEWNTSDVVDSITGLAAGAISVTITDANGCDKVARDTVGFGVGIFTPANDLSARIYPNPAASQVFVEVTLDKAGDVEIVVMNSLGQAVIRQTETATQVVSTALNISSLPAGIYLVQISSGDANTVQKLIVE